MHRFQLFCHNQGIYLNEYGSSCQTETSPLICSTNQWAGFCIIGTSVMKDSRRFLSPYIEILLVHVVKHNLLFLFFFLYLPFVSRIFTIHRAAGEGRRAISLYSFCHFYPLDRQFGIIWVIAAEGSPLRKTGSRNRAWELFTRSLEFTFSILALVAAIVRKMDKTRVTLGNISRALLNLTKKYL